MEQNTGLIWTVVRRLSHRRYDPEDLFQIGVIGLLKAIDRFDLRYQAAFSSYALPLILGELRRFLRDDSLVHVSRSLKEQSTRILKAQNQLLQELGHTPSLAELSVHLSLSPAEVSAALASCGDVESLDAAFSGSAGEEATLLDRLTDSETGEEAYVERLALQESLQQLSEQEQALIRLRYFNELTQSEAGRRLAMSQVQVSRLEKKILHKLRGAMTDS